VVNKVVNKITLWTCDICQTRYEDKDQAKWCESLGTPKIQFKKGDIVVDTEGVLNRPLVVQEITIVNVKKADGSFEHRAFYACIMPGEPQPYTFKFEELKLKK